MTQPYSDRLKTATITYGVRQILITLVGIAANIFLTRILPPKDFGVIAIITMVLTLGTILSDGGLGVFLIQRKDEVSDRTISEILNVQLVASFAIMTLLALLTATQGLFGLSFPLFAIMTIAALSIPLSMVRGMALIRLERNVLFNRISLVDILEQFAYATVAILLARAGYGIWSVAWALVARSAVGCVIAAAVAPFKYCFALPKLSREFSDGVRYAMHYQGAQLINLVRASINPIFINSALGLQSGGYVERASFINSTPTGFIASIQSKVFFPFSSRIQDDRFRLRAFLENSIYLNSVIDKVFYLPLVLYADEMVSLILTDRWTPILPLLKTLMWSTMVFGSLSAPLFPVINALGGTKFLFRFNLIIMVLSWIMMVPLCLWFGIMGVGISTVLIWLFVFLLHKETEKYLPGTKFLACIAKPTFVAFITYAIMYLFRKTGSYSITSLTTLAIFSLLTIILFLLLMLMSDRKKLLPLTAYFIKELPEEVRKY